VPAAATAVPVATTEHAESAAATRPLAAPDGMVAIPAGTLRMGRLPYGVADAMDVPEHDVPVKAFAMSLHEITNGEYKEFLDANSGAARPPASWKGRNPAHLAPLPVVDVSQDDAGDYCLWKFPPHGRLPTESEWEWAARGPEGNLYPWGNDFRRPCANWNHPDASGTLVTSDKHLCGATPLGLTDMSGNAWEWTSSLPTAYPGSSAHVSVGLDLWVVRGGSYFNHDPNDLTATTRQFAASANKFIGFRCAADLIRR
jgi:serine/threonine-protein kinase